jgi:hypothetical protein
MCSTIGIEKSDSAAGTERVERRVRGVLENDEEIDLWWERFGEGVRGLDLCACWGSGFR